MPIRKVPLGVSRAVRSVDKHLHMYDALTARYTFACPRGEQAHVALSSFRLLERLPGAAHPAVYGVRFDCTCGDEHPGLVSHDDLDWAPLGARAGGFVDLMTSRAGDAADELLDSAATHLRAGEWPWSFFCYPEGRPRPVFPSAFVAVAPGERWLGLAVRCPAPRIPPSTASASTAAAARSIPASSRTTTSTGLRSAPTPAPSST